MEEAKREMNLWKSDILELERLGSGRSLERRRAFNREIHRIRGGGGIDKYSFFAIGYDSDKSMLLARGNSGDSREMVFQYESEEGKPDLSKGFHESQIVLRRIEGEKDRYVVEKFGTLHELKNKTIRMEWFGGQGTMSKNTKIHIKEPLPESKSGDGVFWMCTIS